jgi:hypothetical protein
MLVVDVGTATLVAGVLIPIVVNIVTKEVASSAVKSILLLVLSAVAGLATVAISGGGVITDAALTNAAVTFVIAVASYYGFWKPTGISPALAEKGSDFGVTVVADPAKVAVKGQREAGE